MKLVFDIGANIGSTTAYFSKIAEQVVCFEPNPNLVEGLKALYENSNVKVDSRALSDSIGTKTFHLANEDTLSTFSDFWINEGRFSKTHNWLSTCEVSTTTIDSIIEEYGVPDFVKIDVEGHEYEVLMGLTSLHEKTVFGFEWTEEEYPRITKAVEHLKALGYNSYSYTMTDMLVNERDLSWSTWESLSIHRSIDLSRKLQWGMIYFKK